MVFDADLQARYPHIRFRRHWELSSDVTYQLGQCQAIVDALCELPMQPAYRKRRLSVSLNKGAQATTAIEGNTLTQDEVAKVAEGEELPKSKAYQAQEVANILEAMNHLLEHVAADKDVPIISPELIRQFHVMVGRDLGEHFDAIPGRFRQDERVVGPYKCPRHEDVPELVRLMCDWLIEEFGYITGRQTFRVAVVQAIVTHVYLEWIHPFGDGNGRTGRLLEFYILLRAGNPDIASHVLSNFYNETRSEYYRQLDRASKDGDLTAFIRYAMQGYLDGLTESLTHVKDSMIEVAWKYLVHETFAEHRTPKKEVFKRRRRLMLLMPPNKALTLDEIPLLETNLARQYAQLSGRTLERDMEELKGMKLVLEQDGKFEANLGLLVPHMATRRRVTKPQPERRQA
jgi:Fic family protein